MNAREPLPLKTESTTSTGADSILPLEVKNLCYQVGQHLLLDNINLSLTEQNVTIILGANGAGKTLLMKACAGLLTPSQGSVNWQHDGEVRKQGQIGYTLVFQKPVLLNRSALANITFALHHLPKSEQTDRARQALQWAGCEKLADLPATKMSTGQQQMISLARAWAINPQVLFLDEPCANLDPEVSLRLEQLILELHLQGMKIVMTTHNLAQAQRLADEIVFVEKGRIAEQSPADDFFRAPKCASAQRFLDLEVMSVNIKYQ